jgi:hypothetical protein
MFPSRDNKLARNIHISQRDHGIGVFLKVYYLRKETPVFSETFNTY